MHPARSTWREARLVSSRPYSFTHAREDVSYAVWVRVMTGPHTHACDAPRIHTRASHAPCSIACMDLWIYGFTDLRLSAFTDLWMSHPRHGVAHAHTYSILLLRILEAILDSPYEAFSTAMEGFAPPAVEIFAYGNGLIG
jgi:hypothetical protein